MLTWECPSCFLTVAGETPVDLHRATRLHIEDHGRAAQLGILEHVQAGCPSPGCPMKARAGMAMLTEYDEILLRGLRVKW